MGNEYKQKAIPIKNGKVTIPNEAELVKSNKYNVQDLTEAFEIHSELNSQVFDLETGKMHPELKDRLV
jgi:hypothetical protein